MINWKWKCKSVGLIFPPNCDALHALCNSEHLHTSILNMHNTPASSALTIWRKGCCHVGSMWLPVLSELRGEPWLNWTQQRHLLTATPQLAMQQVKWALVRGFLWALSPEGVCLQLKPPGFPVRAFVWMYMCGPHGPSKSNQGHP